MPFNGLLNWIGLGFGIQQLTLQPILRYIFYPVTFSLVFLEEGASLYQNFSPRSSLSTSSLRILYYSALQNLMKFGPNPLSPRAFTICSYGLCGFANLGSLGILIGMLSALAPTRRKVIARIAFSMWISVYPTNYWHCVSFNIDRSTSKWI